MAFYQLSRNHVGEGDWQVLPFIQTFYLVPFFSYASSLLTVTNAPGSRSSVVQPHPRLTSCFGWRRHRSLTVDLRVSKC